VVPGTTVRSTWYNYVLVLASVVLTIPDSTITQCSYVQHNQPLINSCSERSLEGQ